MTYNEELRLLLIDKAILVGVAAVIWHFYSRWQKRIDNEQQRADRLEQEAQELKKSLAIQNIDLQIQFLESSLEKFYWPLTLCMRKDDAIWHRVPALYDDGTQLPTEAGTHIESKFLLPNHEHAVSIIESQFHFIATENELIEPLIRYIRHVAVFKSLRALGSELNPIDVEEPFPDDINEQLQRKMELCRSNLAKLREQRSEFAVSAT